MSHSLINLTLPIVTQEIDIVLREYPEDPYQLAFSIHELRQKLIAHILSHVPNRYSVEGMQGSCPEPKGRYSSPLDERLQIEIVIHESILHILHENSDWLGCNIPPTALAEDQAVAYQSY